MKEQNKAFEKAWSLVQARLPSGQMDCKQAGLAMWQAALSQHGEPVAVVTCEGVKGVRFTAACDFGTTLKPGTELFTRPVAEPAKPVSFDVTPESVKFEIFAPRGMGGFVTRPASGVRITHVPTGLFAEHSEDRSQHRNKAIAFEKLKQMVEAAKNGQPAKGSDETSLDASFLERFFEQLVKGDFAADNDEDLRNALRARAMVLNQLPQEGKGGE